MERKFIDDSIIKLRVSKYLEKALTRAGFSRVVIQQTPMLTRITVYVTNPGRAIGRGGQTIEELTDVLKNKFHIDNPQISISEVANPRLEPRIIASRITASLEKGSNVRRLLHATIRDIMSNGAMGAEIIAGGKLAAKGARAKQIKLRLGYLPKSGNLVKLVDEAKVAAYPKYGAIGVIVRIVQPGTVFPDNKLQKKVALPKAMAVPASQAPVPVAQNPAPAPVPTHAPAVTTDKKE